jgi:fructan beta-fructosidase
MKSSVVVLFALIFTTARSFAQQPDIVFADFEGSNYGAWKVEGTAFGSGPAQGKIGEQMEVDGFMGKGLVSSFNGGDDAVGRLTSPEFTIQRKFIRFLIGGGGFAGETCINLLVDGKAVHTATGLNTQPGGSEHLSPASWDVHDLVGKTGRLEIVDQRKGGWGHINVDEIVFTDTNLVSVVPNLARDIVITESILHFPVKNGAPKRNVKVLVDGKVVRFFDIELADDTPDWWAPLDVRAWKGKTITVVVDNLPANSKALALVEQDDLLKNSSDLYHESLRPQFHFSARRGWNNDPNGLTFFQGEYYLFFQHNPYGTGWGNMHWGQATSSDLVHWEEHGDVLYPDDLGAIFSGSAVVDRSNTSGFGEEGKPPLVLIYTAAGHPFTQCLAYSLDGRTFSKYEGNPVVGEISSDNRDPKVIWYEPDKKWVMVLYSGVNDTVLFLDSPDLKHWTRMSQVSGFAECPDLFELPVDSDSTKMKWVLTGANSNYIIGSFDGTVFTPETDKLKGNDGSGFYAAQTYSDEPKHRRIRIGWLQAPAPGMPFNQEMSLPMELSLRTTPDGPRMAWQPVPELATLRGKSFSTGALTLNPGDSNPVAQAKGELIELRAKFQPGDTSEVSFNVRGINVTYNAKKQELSVNGQHTTAPLQDGHQDVTIYLDSTSIEVFAADGLVYAPMPVIPAADNRNVQVSVQGAPVKFSSLDVYELKSAWR